MTNVTLTTSTGAPVADDNNSISAGERGSLTFDNHQMFEKLAHFNRERIPERVVHARGSAAYGSFTLTKDLSDYSIAPFLQKVGEKTEIFLRFSTVGGGQDSSDYARDPRGFAVKFYTEQGNFDIVGNNTPVFFLRDPIKFPDFVHSQKKNPATNIPDPKAIYEFWASNPQSLHQMTILMSDRGIPYSYRHMNGYGSHTLSLWNSEGERFWVKWHFKTLQGNKTLTGEEATTKPSFGAQQDLVESIANGDFPKWVVKLQIMTEQQASEASYNPFDVTKVWPHDDFPLIEVGELELNRNVENFFAENEQAAFSPGNLVPGVGASPDKMLQGRLLAYPDAQRYRLGANYNQLAVNAPRCPMNHYQRDGGHATNQNGSVNFYPNDQQAQGAPAPDPSIAEPPMPFDAGYVKAWDSRDEDNFSQAGNLYRIMSDDQKNQLADNIAGGLSQASESAQQRMLDYLAQADADYAGRVKQRL